MIKRNLKNKRAALSAAALLSAAVLSGCGIGANAQTGAAQNTQTVAVQDTQTAEMQNTETTAVQNAVPEMQAGTAEAYETETEETSAETTGAEALAQETAGADAITAQSAGANVITAQSAAAPSFEPRDETVYIQTDNVNVRTSPEVNNGENGTENNLAFLALRGQEFHRTAYSDGFSKVEKDGKTYYISSEYLAVTPPAAETDSAAKENSGDKTVAAGTEAHGAAQGSGADLKNGQEIGLDSSWKYADFAEIKSGKAVLYKASLNRKEKIIAVNAGHGTKGGTSVKTWCHPDKTPKVTGGTTGTGATKAAAVSSGMNFNDGTPEKTVTLRMAQILKEKLLAAGYDVLMLRDGEDVQLDNVARSVIANNTADCHIALHWDGDGLSTIKGCFYMSVPDKLKGMEPVASHWQEHERLGDSLIAGLKAQGMKIWGSNPLDMDLTQTSFSTIPSVDIELGNQVSRHDDEILQQQADGLVAGVNSFFGN